jgi:hypothetical protein
MKRIILIIIVFIICLCFITGCSTVYMKQPFKDSSKSTKKIGLFSSLEKGLVESLSAPARPAFLIKVMNRHHSQCKGNGRIAWKRNI